MHILYLVSAAGNPLYHGQYALHGKYMTFGQQSFILVLVTGLAKHGETVTLAINGLSEFALAGTLRRYCRVIEAIELPLTDSYDLVLLDERSDELLDVCPSNVPLFRIVHNAATPFSVRLQQRCDRWFCLTERSQALLNQRLPAEKLILSHQGVDLDRFQPRRRSARPDGSPPRVLIYARLDADRSPAIWPVLEALEKTDLPVTLLGDGDLFWKISDRFARSITLVHFVPCTSIQNFLPSFDVVISSARGVMEALAMGIPTICAGPEYAAIVHSANIADHLTVNITGYGMGTDPGHVLEDVRNATLVSAAECRHTAETHCSVQHFIDRLLSAYAQLPQTTQITN